MKKKQINWKFILLGIILIFIGITSFNIKNVASNEPEYWEEDTDYYYYGDEGPLTEFSYRATEQLIAEGINVPLYLQTDERWEFEEIDYNLELTMAEAGSGFTSMMMLQAYLQNIDYDYFEFYDWVYDDYFTADQNLKWKFFKNAAADNGFSIQSLGDNFDRAQEFLEAGEPVIASFKPNTFEVNEHFAVLVQATDRTLHVLDPLDSPEKEHYQIDYSPDELADQIQNYWAAE